MKLFSICAAFLVLSSCSGDLSPGPSLKTLWRDFQARQEIKSEKYEEALSRYFDLLEVDGGQAGTHSNIGVLFSKMQKPEDALKSLQHALNLAQQKAEPKSIFTVYYNLGVYFGAQKKVEEALLNYQAALDIVPDSTEVKTNIELLIQQQKQDQKDEQKKEGQGQGQNQQDQKDPKDDKDKKGDKGKDDKDQKDKDQKDKDKDKDGEAQDKKQDQPRQSSPKYQPRPFKGEQLSEGDVKKILGELKNQEQKIRANFDKKEKGKSQTNEKDW